VRVAHYGVEVAVVDASSVGTIEGLASMMTVLVAVAVSLLLSMAT
jgi:hypothetical protein